MQSKYVVILLALISFSAHAESILNLKNQNEKLLALKAELEIAKTKSELEKTRFESMSISNANTVKPVKTSPLAELDMVELVAVSGDINAPVATFIVGGGTVSRRLGESLNGWILQRVNANEASFTKSVSRKLGKKTTEDKFQRSIYLSVHRQNQPLSKPAIPSNSMPTAMTVPAVAPDLRQVK